MSRPEHTAPPEIFYNETEAKKYTGSSRMIEIQFELTNRALELLNLPAEMEHAYLLDIGCGSGLSGDAITENGYEWVGVDISKSMIDVAVDRETDGDMILRDMGTGLPFRAGVFDGAVSISALQWLCNQDQKDHSPKQRLMTFFQTLYASLAVGARAVLQFYPENHDQLEFMTSCAMRSGFSGGVVVDYPNSAKAKKYYLVLLTGTGTFLPPKALGEDGEEEDAVRVHQRRKRKGGKGDQESTREWVLAKKERQRRQGKNVRPDTRYTARKRTKVRF
eukprot:c4649_g1_i1.p1 GENE.c4649_g1_i1~~c4649_g1_i1.p1  ORF type:complete len:277 (+),score=119.65 c4649_g1_i1:43-873(+)